MLLSFKIVCGTISTRRRRLPIRRVWEHKTRFRKKINALVDFLANPSICNLDTPKKADLAILVNTDTDFKNVRLTHLGTGLVFYQSVERVTASGFLVADFDVLPPGFRDWSSVDDELGARLAFFGIDGVFIPSASLKTKLLIPVIHDLSAPRHGTSVERVICLRYLVGERLSAALDESQAANKSAFLTQEGAQAFILQTRNPLRGATMKDLLIGAKAAGVSRASDCSKNRNHTGDIPQKKVVAAAGRPSNHKALYKRALAVARSLLDASYPVSGHPTSGPRRRRQAVLAAMLVLGGAASSSSVASTASMILGRAIPQRTLSSIMQGLVKRSLFVRRSPHIIKIRSAGLSLTYHCLSNDRVRGFLRSDESAIYPNDGEWNAYLFMLTGVFSSRADFLDFVGSLNGVKARPDRLLKAREAWSSHSHRMNLEKQEHQRPPSGSRPSPNVLFAG